MSTPTIRAVTADGGQSVINAAVEEAASIAARVAMAVTDPSGELVALEGMDGAPLPAVGVAIDKAWTVSAFVENTETLEEMPNVISMASCRARPT